MCVYSTCNMYFPSCDRLDTGGWTAEDDFIYQAVVDQYGYDVPHRRTIYLDRLRRHLPHKTRAKLVSAIRARI